MGQSSTITLKDAASLGVTASHDGGASIVDGDIAQNFDKAVRDSAKPSDHWYVNDFFLFRHRAIRDSHVFDPRDVPGCPVAVSKLKANRATIDIGTKSGRPFRIEDHFIADRAIKPGMPKGLLKPKERKNADPERHPIHRYYHDLYKAY